MFRWENCQFRVKDLVGAKLQFEAIWLRQVPIAHNRIHQGT